VSGLPWAELRWGPDLSKSKGKDRRKKRKDDIGEGNDGGDEAKGKLLNSFAANRNTQTRGWVGLNQKGRYRPSRPPRGYRGLHSPVSGGKGFRGSLDDWAVGRLGKQV